MGSGLSRVFTVRISVIMALALLCAPISGFARQSAPPNDQAQNIDAEAFRIQAEMHHSLTLHYLKSGDVDKALAEARQIIQPPIPPKLEVAVANSMSIITDQLKDLKRFDIAQTLLDETFKATMQLPVRVMILQNKARLYLLSGENDKAIEVWKRAKDLEARIRS